MPKPKAKKVKKTAKKVRREEKKEIKKAVKKAAKKFNVVRMGGRIGGLFGRQGARVGAEAGRLFRQLTGFGDYKVNSNSIMTSGTDSLPRFANTGTGHRIRHREYLFDVITSSTIGQFTNTVVPIQPGLLSSFPWFSALAENYEEYTINGMVFEFKSNSYDALASTNTASGTVIMTTQYNVLSPPFINKFQMEQYEYTCSNKPSRDILHPVECAHPQTPVSVLNVRSGPVSTGDLRLYDWGNFNIATVGMQGASTNIGELWVTFDISLLKPKLGSTVDVFDHWIIDPAHASPNGSPFGLLPANRRLVSTSDIGLVLGANTITFPTTFSGAALIIYTWQVTGAMNNSTNAPLNWTPVGGVAELPLWGTPFAGGSPPALTGWQAILGAGAAQMEFNQTQGYNEVLAVRVTNGGGLTVTGGTGSPAASGVDLFVIALPYSIA